LVFKEAIHNIAKHSDASKVEVTFELKGRTFLLLVTDNGSDPELRLGKRKSGQGMRNMNLRAKRIGAALSVGWANGFKVEMRGKL
jgi:signal transduction histidine kinase